jgi:ASC-1-like (ASCH) protein
MGTPWFSCRILVIVLLILVILLAVSVAILASRGGRYAGGGDDECGGDDSDYTDDDTDESYDGGGKGNDLAVREPYFQAVLDGKIRVIGRINRGHFKDIKDGAEVTIRRSRPKGDTTEFPGVRRFKATITARKDYPSAEKMVAAEGAAKLYPGIKSDEKAVEAFRGEFHTKEDEDSHGVVAFHIKKE